MESIVFCFSSEKIEKGQKITSGTMQNGRGAFFDYAKNLSFPLKNYCYCLWIESRGGVGVACAIISNKRTCVIHRQLEQEMKRILKYV